MTDQLPTVINGLVLAAVLWLVRTTNQTDRELAVVKVLLEKLNEEASKNSSRWHQLRNSVAGVEARVAVLESRVEDHSKMIEARLDAIETRMPKRRGD